MKRKKWPGEPEGGNPFRELVEARLDGEPLRYRRCRCIAHSSREKVGSQLWIKFPANCPKHGYRLEAAH